MARPPTGSDQQILYSIIEENPGVSLDALAGKTGFLLSELIPILQALEACGLIRREGLAFRPRGRKKQPPAPSPGWFARLRRRLANAIYYCPAA